MRQAEKLGAQGWRDPDGLIWIRHPGGRMVAFHPNGVQRTGPISWSLSMVMQYPPAGLTQLFGDIEERFS